jgi:Zn-dependent protease with chaperone function
MSLQDQNVTFLTEITTWFSQNSILGIGIILTIIGVILTLSELKQVIKHDSPSDQLIFWLMVLLAGLVTVALQDLILGLLAGISILMVVETIKMRDTPVWGKLIAATTVTYMVILIGRAAQVIYDIIVQPAEPNDFIFATSFNLAFPIFLIISFVFFGRKFILVSRFSSPQVVYLFLFGIVYSGIIALRKTVFPEDENGLIQAYNYLNIEGEWRTRVIFADFGTFEALTIVMIGMYFISGWLLTVLMGIKPVEDPIVLDKVRKVAETMGIKGEIKVGFVSAPIINAFAFGPFHDKRVAFISSEITDFTDDDIKGIVGHELAHASRHHIVILLIISIIELGVKKALAIPATSLDYSFLPEEAVSTIGFVGYYFLSYGLFIVLLIFVRILEGDADKTTKEAGYAVELAQALFKLEGFYNGVAADLGISANLLTDRKYTIPERERFTAQAGRLLYEELIKPTRGSAFANVFQSHPRTVYRIAALIIPDLNPKRTAFYPYRLLGFFMRKKALKEISAVHEEFSALIDEKYESFYGDKSLDTVLEYMTWDHMLNPLVNKKIVAYNSITEDVISGEVTEIVKTNRTSTPYHAIVNDKKIDMATYDVKLFKEGEKYFLKNGSIVIPNSYSQTEDGVVFTAGVEEDEIIKFDRLGHPLSFFENLVGNIVIIFENGLSRLETVQHIEFGESWADTQITLNDKTYSGNDLIVSFPPLGIELRKSKMKEQRNILEHLINKNILLYTKDNVDISLAGRITEIKEEILIFEDGDGTQDVKLDRLEYIVFVEPTVELINKNHVSIFTKFLIKWSNRKGFKYIYT